MLTGRKEQSSRGLQSNAFKDWPMAGRLLIPEGSWKLAPGRGRYSGRKPGDRRAKGIRPRQRVAEGVAVRGSSDASGTPFRVRIFENRDPGVVVAIAPRPPANFHDPCRDQISDYGYLLFISL